MTWWGQLIVSLIAAVCFMLLINSYRRQDAMQNMFLLGMLLAIGAIFIPETILCLPLCWWCLFTLRANNFRTILASLLGVAIVSLYAALAVCFLPDATWVNCGMAVWMDAFERAFGILSQPLWIVITTCILGVVGFMYLVAHFRRYSTANVRIQTRLLIATPFYWLSLLSCLFPSSSGNCLLSMFWLSSLYLIILYTATYGLPRFNNPFARRSSYPTRSFSRRSRRRRR